MLLPFFLPFFLLEDEEDAVGDPNPAIKSWRVDDLVDVVVVVVVVGDILLAVIGSRYIGRRDETNDDDSVDNIDTDMVMITSTSSLFCMKAVEFETESIAGFLFDVGRQPEWLLIDVMVLFSLDLFVV